MTRRMFVDVTVRLVIDAEEVTLQEIMDELDYDFSYPVSCGYLSANIVDMQIEDYELLDSK